MLLFWSSHEHFGISFFFCLSRYDDDKYYDKKPKDDYYDDRRDDYDDRDYDHRGGYDDRRDDYDRHDDYDRRDDYDHRDDHDRRDDYDDYDDRRGGRNDHDYRDKDYSRDYDDYDDNRENHAKNYPKSGRGRMPSDAPYEDYERQPSGSYDPDVDMNEPTRFDRHGAPKDSRPRNDSHGSGPPASSTFV